MEMCGSHWVSEFGVQERVWTEKNSVEGHLWVAISSHRMRLGKGLGPDGRGAASQGKSKSV